MNTSPTIRGTCHCGAVTWNHDGLPESVTVCNCTLCRRTGALWAYDYDDEGIRVMAAPGALGAYSWGDKSLAVHFCTTCSNVSHWRALTPDAAGRVRIAVNMRLADPDQVGAIPLKLFDGFASWTSLPPDGRCIADLWFQAPRLP